MLLVLGYGNSLRGDDGFGPAVTSYLQSRVGDHRNLEILCHQQLLPEHAEKVAMARLVIFVDISLSLEGGQIECLKLAKVDGKKSQQTQPILPHSLSHTTILELAADLYGHCPEAYLYTVGAVSLELGETLSPPVEEAVAKVSEMIMSTFSQIDQMEIADNLCH